MLCDNCGDAATHVVTLAKADRQLPSYPTCGDCEPRDLPTDEVLVMRVQPLSLFDIREERREPMDPTGDGVQRFRVKFRCAVCWGETYRVALTERDVLDFITAGHGHR